MTIGKAGELAQDVTDADFKNPACLVWNSRNGQQNRIGYKLEDTTPGAIGNMVEDIGTVSPKPSPALVIVSESEIPS